MGIESYKIDKRMYVLGEFDGRVYPFLGEENINSLELLKVGEYFRGMVIKTIEKTSNTGLSVICEDVNRKNDKNFQGDEYKYHFKYANIYDGQFLSPKNNASLMVLD